MSHVLALLDVLELLQHILCPARKVPEEEEGAVRWAGGFGASDGLPLRVGLEGGGELRKAVHGGGLDSLGGEGHASHGCDDTDCACRGAGEGGGS